MLIALTRDDLEGDMNKQQALNKLKEMVYEYNREDGVGVITKDMHKKLERFIERILKS